MSRLTPIGRAQFATALVVFGVLHFIARDFVTARAPAWPAGVPGQLVFAYTSGLIVLAAGISIFTNKHARPLLVAVATMVMAWSFLRHVPLVLADHSMGGEWTNAGKAVAFSGGALAVVGSFSTGALRQLVWAGRVGLGLFMILAGIQHFMFVPFVMTLIPSWIPGAHFWTLFAGIALIAGGTGMLLPRIVRLAASLSGLMILLWVPLVHLPLALSRPGINDWQALFEALAFSGLAFVIAGVSEGQRQS